MEQLLELLIGASRPMKSKDIKKLIGLHDTTVRKYVNALRVMGYPVCSSDDGYYLSYSKKDVLDTIHSLEGRVMGMNTAINGLRLIVDDLTD
jgi:biotin operon repressor